MRLLGENKTAAEKCRHCSRPIGDKVGHCRPTREGNWWCWTEMKTFYDPAKLIAPTLDPIGEAEQAVIDLFAQPIVDAQLAIDTALASYTIAQLAHHAGLSEAQEIGVSSRHVAIPVRPGMRHREATDMQRRVMVRRLDLLFQGEEEAAARLSAARGELNRLEDRRDRKRRTVRDAA